MGTRNHRNLLVVCYGATLCTVVASAESGVVLALRDCAGSRWKAGLWKPWQGCGIPCGEGIDDEEWNCSSSLVWLWEELTQFLWICGGEGFSWTAFWGLSLNARCLLDNQRSWTSFSRSLLMRIFRANRERNCSQTAAIGVFPVLKDLDILPKMITEVLLSSTGLLCSYR